MRDVIVHSDIVVSKVDIKENPADMVTITLFVAILSVAWTWLVFVVELALKGLCWRGGEFLVEEWSVIPCIGICVQVEIYWNVTQILLSIGNLVEEALKKFKDGPGRKSRRIYFWCVPIFRLRA